MRVMTYNIYQGGALLGFEAIAEVIQSQNPDVVCLQEVNPLRGRSQFTQLIDALQLPHYVLSCTDDSRRFPVATFSKYPILNFKDISLKMRNGGLVTRLETPQGNINVCNAHLNPHGEQYRIREAKIILRAARNGKSIILGTFGTKQQEKFCEEGLIQCDTTQLLTQAGYVDVANVLSKNHIATAPTPAANEPAHTAPVRIDYVFASVHLLENLRQYKVIRTPLARQASDHYPIIVDLD